MELYTDIFMLSYLEYTTNELQFPLFSDVSRHRISGISILD